MRHLPKMLVVMAAAVLLNGSVSLANEPVNQPGQSEGKDACLLVAMNCSDNADSIQMRIERLNREIAKGSAVYTNDELKVLRRELEDATRNLEVIITGS